MENKYVGYLVIGISAVVVAIIFIFNSALKEIVKVSCTAEHAVTCPMYTTINEQTYLALSIAGLLVILGIILIFTKPSERIIVKKIKETKHKKNIDLSSFNKEEKQVFNLISNNKAIFQSDLIEKTGIGKVRISRIIDRLEGKGLVERKRRGLTNVVVFKED